MSRNLRFTTSKSSFNYEVHSGLSTAVCPSVLQGRKEIHSGDYPTRMVIKSSKNIIKEDIGASQTLKNKQISILYMFHKKNIKETIKYAIILQITASHY